MQQIKFYEGNMDRRLRPISGPATPVFLCLFGILFLLLGALGWLSMMRPSGFPPQALWVGRELMWGGVNTITGVTLLIGASIHVRHFSLGWFRFESSRHHSEVASMIGRWLASHPYYFARLSAVSMSDEGAVYDLEVVEPRVAGDSNGIVGALSTPRALPEHVGI